MSAKSVAPDASFRPSILFVCLGNICRSPLAELAMRVEAAENGLDLSIDSAGTGDWHVGNAPDQVIQGGAMLSKDDQLAATFAVVHLR